MQGFFLLSESDAYFFWLSSGKANLVLFVILGVAGSKFTFFVSLDVLGSYKLIFFVRLGVAGGWRFTFF